LLTDARAEMGVQDHLRRTADTAGVRAAHPLLDVDLIELVLSLRPELTFHPELDRALVRHALRGLVPDAVRLRRDKVSFNALLLDAIRDREFAAFGAMLDRSDLELACIADADGVRALWRDGPERHAHGGWAWSVEVWRAFAAETWLRRQNGIEP
jgi:asparagine synthase (glutamine-hydrolysing)